LNQRPPGYEPKRSILSLADSTALGPRSCHFYVLRAAILHPSKRGLLMSKAFELANCAPGTRGRKPASQSRAAEFRERLAAWLQTPESSRPPLRAVARELGTSHQLLSHYLKKWDKRREKAYARLAAEIRARAASEDRPLTASERSQADAYKREAVQAMLETGFQGWLMKLKAGGTLSKAEIRFVHLAARKGFPTAQKIVSYCQNEAKHQKNNLPAAHSGIAKSFRSEST